MVVKESLLGYSQVVDEANLKSNRLVGNLLTWDPVLLFMLFLVGLVSVMVSGFGILTRLI
ncbi:hypothetical protein LBSG162_03440 [Lentilactobacillus buchneri subsp. silagei]|nr:hypothetical protein Ltb232_13070 [Lentilactobacillus buchneri subsp. silagei]GED91239.1 hypothetical protein LBSG162_03440 [Lentilactobacillus buchneri subsp. silagei]GED93610.1 hypothetical protein LBSP_01700 [Lentilactobacillus buchneri subsp. silagei]